MKVTISALTRLALVLVLFALHGAARVEAQNDFGSATDLFPNLSLNGFGEAEEEEPVEWSARYYADSDGTGRLEVEASLGATWHIYSTTQKPGGPTRTKLTIDSPENVKLSGEFKPDHTPKKSISDVYDGLSVEEHEGVVTWSAPITVPAGFNGPITVSAIGLVCSGDRCMPTREKVTAEHAGEPSEAVALAGTKDAASVVSKADENVAEPFRDGDYVVQWTAVVSSKQLAPGQSGFLQFTAKPDPKFHVYKSVIDDSDSSTNFVVTDKAGLRIGQPVADKPFVTKTILPSLPAVSYYNGQVTWQLPIEIPKDATEGEKQLEGMIAYQACTDDSCYPPSALKFTASVMVGPNATEPAAIKLVTAKSSAALDAAATIKWADSIQLGGSSSPAIDDVSDAAAVVPITTSTPPGSSGSTSATSFPLLLLFALVGGLILNVMPCVLPVVGLKIMGFVAQAGEDRKRVLVLNLVYVLGIMSVFAILAVVAAVSKFGWGEQFTYFPVRLGLTLALFALALSYLGVWEIPVPGMAAGKTSQDLQSREGLVGAFSKGVFATILATPCSGPLLGYILGLTLELSPAHTIAIFLTVGLGMSLPYLVIGAQPKLVAWLPKPGPWMETLKQLMAFLFLGTVAFFFAQFNEAQKVPVFVSLIAVWFGCWIIGQVPNWAELQKRVLAWVVGIAAATLISMGAFTYLKANPELAWQDYSEIRLTQLQREGKTVLLDFGAKWCVNCKINYKIAINTPRTREVVDELDAVALYADWTDYNEEIKSKLEELDSRSIPLLVIYPGSRPDKPIILRDLVTQDAVVEALREAGASIDRTAAAGTARTAIASNNR